MKRQSGRGIPDAIETGSLCICIEPSEHQYEHKNRNHDPATQNTGLRPCPTRRSARIVPELVPKFQAMIDMPSNPDRIREHLLLEALRCYPTDPGLALHRANEAYLFADNPVQSPVLDIGCHDGVFRSLATLGSAEAIDCWGCDLDTSALSKAHFSGRYQAVLGADVTKLPFGRDMFRTVLANSVVTHIPDLDDALSEIHRVLKPGGMFIATVPTPAFYDRFAPVLVLRKLGLSRRAEAFAESYDARWGQRHFLACEAWRDRLAENGFRLQAWQEYMDDEATFRWSGLFWLVRLGIGRLTVGAILRRLVRPGSRPFAIFNRYFARRLVRSVGTVQAGSSAVFVAVAEKEV